jgi:Cys-rich repeat protein
MSRQPRSILVVVLVGLAWTRRAEAQEAPNEESGCKADSDCKAGRTCEAGVCTSPKPKACAKDTDCDGELVCEALVCVTPKKVAPVAPPTPTQSVAPKPVPVAPVAPTVPGVPQVACAERRAQIAAEANAERNLTKRVALFRSMPTCREGEMYEAPASAMTSQAAPSLGSPTNAFAWQFTGHVGLNYASAGVSSTTDFVVAQSAAIGGYVAQSESGRHALVILESYNFYFNEAENAFAILGAGYRFAKSDNNSSFQFGPGVAAIGSGNNNSLLGFGLIVEGLVAGKAPTGFAIVGNLGYFDVSGVGAVVLHLGVGIGFGG